LQKVAIRNNVGGLLFAQRFSVRLFGDRWCCQGYASDVRWTGRTRSLWWNFLVGKRLAYSAECVAQGIHDATRATARAPSLQREFPLVH
jgi:hypothetical protein